MSANFTIAPRISVRAPAARQPLLLVRASKGFGKSGGSKGSKQGVKPPKPAQEERAAFEARLGAAAPPQPPSVPSSSAAAAAADSEREDGKYTAMPQQVTDRMLKRILIFSGLPVATGILLYPFFYFLKVTKGIDLPTWVVYIASTLTFGGGLAGISFGILSSSWDPRREGSALGLTEFQANLPILMERFKRQ